MFVGKYHFISPYFIIIIDKYLLTNHKWIKPKFN